MILRSAAVNSAPTRRQHDGPGYLRLPCPKYFVVVEALLAAHDRGFHGLAT